MYSKILLCLLAGITTQTLSPAAAAERSGDSAAYYAQSQTETGESSGGGQPYPGGAGMTGTEGKGKAETEGMESHVKEAMKRAKAAVDSGKKGDAAGVGKHAEAAKPHVEAAM